MIKSNLVNTINCFLFKFQLNFEDFVLYMIAYLTAKKSMTNLT